jgi:hypothetical protein
MPNETFDHPFQQTYKLDIQGGENIKWARIDLAGGLCRRVAARLRRG